VGAPGALQADLCERLYKWVKAGPEEVKRDVKQLESKDDFRKRHHRSPDDGDGCALACAPDYVFIRQLAMPLAQGVGKGGWGGVGRGK